jgi:sugar phosphate isomerase/epimerase
MKLGMLTGLWYVAESATVIESLRRVANLGFRYVDLHGVFHAGPAHLSARDREAVRVEMAALGLEPRNYVLHSPKNLAGASDAEIEECLAYMQEGIDLALTWDVHQLMLNAGQWAYGVERDYAWNKAVRFIQRVCDYAAPRQMYVAIESEPYVWYLINDVRSTHKMLEDVGRPNLATLLDLGHLALAREGASEIYSLQDTIIHAHFSDHSAFQHTNQIIGSGITQTADYLGMLLDVDIDQRVKKFGYEELVISYELGFPGDVITDPDSWVRESLDHVQRVAPYMRLA